MIDAAAAAWVCVFAPLVGAALTPLCARFSVRAGGAVAILFSFLAAAAAVRLLPELLDPHALPIESGTIWLETPVAIGRPHTCISNDKVCLFHHAVSRAGDAGIDKQVVRLALPWGDGQGGAVENRKGMGDVADIWAFGPGWRGDLDHRGS